MPATDVEIHPDALIEADAGVAWYLERSLGAAERFFAEVERAFEAILEAPERWPLHLHGTRRYLLYKFPYCVIYQASGSVVRIYAVAHTKRRPGYWKARLTRGTPSIM
jgi:plasmid stabilization system protein ParE